MTGRTHDLAAFTAINLLFVTQPIPTMTLATLVTALGATFIGGLTPDIDQPTADLWRRLPAGNIIGRLITPILGSHRMISHSFVGIYITGWLTEWVLTKVSGIVLVDMDIVWWAFMSGFVSHIVIDLLTIEGEPLLFPLPWKFGIPPIKRLRVKTGGMVEKTIIFPMLMVLNGYLVYTFYTRYLDFFRQYIR